jgi:hypothetical protein
VESSFPRGSSRPIRSVSSSIPIVRATLGRRRRTRRSTVSLPKARSRSIFRDTVCSPSISEVAAFQHLRCLRKAWVTLYTPEQIGCIEQSVPAPPMQPTVSTAGYKAGYRSLEL